MYTYTNMKIYNHTYTQTQGLLNIESIKVIWVLSLITSHKIAIIVYAMWFSFQLYRGCMLEKDVSILFPSLPVYVISVVLKND